MIMKKYILILSAILAVAVLPSCSQQLLEVEQKGVMETDPFYANANDEQA